MILATQQLDCEQSLHKSVEQPAFLMQSSFVTQTNKTTEGSLGRGEKEGTAPVAVTAFRMTKSVNLISKSDITDGSVFFLLM